MRVIFLDVDGVLVNRFALKLAHDMKMREIADPRCVKNLNALTARTGAKIVISSCWRIGRTVDELKQLLHKWRVEGEVIGKTINNWDWERGQEIQEWLDRHPECESFVIIDDDRDMKHLLSKLVQTRFEPGLTAADVVRAARILENESTTQSRD